MKLELKSFQDAAAREILKELDDSREAVARGRVQAVILSAPTGSGKTITIAQVIDFTLGGGDGIAPRPDTVFLWLSDSPELNTQSVNKLLGACDNLPFHRMITIGSENFDEDRLQPGYVYFINTQLLGRDKLLTKDTGDRRTYTFWQTIANTIDHAPQDFVLIIDEAHRGATATDRTRTPIMQKFILGSAADGLPPVPLVLGMSATPQRFTTLLGNTDRTQRRINIDPDDVRSSGLLKDWIIVQNPKDTTVGELTLLKHAAKKWKHFTHLWSEYCTREREADIVRPILVVQVEDGNDRTITKTPLDDVVRVIERESGPLAVNEIVHCFQDSSEILAAGRIIRKLEASRIQSDSAVKVVLFKTALTTGWDCPRAEVMMSFRRAQDATNIAQLVGRMIRTPLARRIGTEEALDTVDLFLPHYDSAALQEVLDRLRNPEAEDGVPTRVEMAMDPYPRNASMKGVFVRLSALPTYSIARVPKMSDIKRALRLAGMLGVEGVDPDADSRLRGTLLNKLKELRDSYAEKDPQWKRTVREGSQLEVDVTQVAIGRMSVSGTTSLAVKRSDEDIDRLFDDAGRLLAAGEGLHRSYWKRFHEKDNPNQAKLELYAVTRRPGTFSSLETLARDEFAVLWAQHKSAIQALPAAVKARFRTLVQAAGKPVIQEWELPLELVERQERELWQHHLYCNDSGVFPAKLNGWERELLKAEVERPDFVGWLRNLPRREWAMCIPYELAGTRPFYPDFIIIRKDGNSYVVDIVEPHDDTRTDTWAKAKGLAAFADSHGIEFGRLIIARKHGQLWQVADVNEKTTRAKARRMQSTSDLESIFSI